MIGKRLTIKGRVQGVSFRFYTQLKAQELGLFGYVINQKNGTVFIEVIGELSQINNFVKWCHIGSPASKVVQIVQEDIIAINEAISKFKDFRIIR